MNNRPQIWEKRFSMFEHIARRIWQNNENAMEVLNGLTCNELSHLCMALGLAHLGYKKREEKVTGLYDFYTKRKTSEV